MSEPCQQSIAVPQELVDRIIDIIGAQSDDPPSRLSLFACSQRKATTLAENIRWVDSLVHILQCDPCRNSAAAKLNLPPLTSHIRSLELDVSISLDSVSAADTQRSRRRAKQRQHQLNTRLVEIFLLLPYVEEFKVKSYVCIDEWTSFDSEFQSTILNFCTSPSIRTLEFEYLRGIPLGSIIEGCTNLNNLILKDVDLGMASYGATTAQPRRKRPKLFRIFGGSAARRPPPQNIASGFSSSIKFHSPTLEFMGVRGSADVLLPLLRNQEDVHSFQSVRQLDISADDIDISSSWSLIRRIAPTLESLRVADVRRRDLMGIQERLIDLGKLPVLRSLEVVFATTSWLTGAFTLSSWQYRTVFSIPSALSPVSTSLETLTLTMKWTKLYPSPEIQASCQDFSACWRQFEGNLISGAFPCLKKLRMNISLNYYLNDDIVVPDKMAATDFVTGIVEEEIRQFLHRLCVVMGIELELYVIPYVLRLT